jgi:glutathione peroxidase
MFPFPGRSALAQITSFSIWAILPLISFADDMTMQAANSTATQATTNAPASQVAPTAPVTDSTSVYAFTVNSLDGKPVDLHQYLGHVALVINIASKSAYGDQFVGLEKLYQAYKDKGFVVLAFPSDDFGHLESGSPQEIAARYANFKLTFPIFELTRVRGDGQSPVYHFLTTGHGTPTWNFHKYLVDKTGKVITEFPSQIKPDNKDLQDAIDAALK